MERLETDRLILRPWTEKDAKKLYQYAKDPRVGPSAGWPIHTSIENSRHIIRHILAVNETYAVVAKAENELVGSISILIGENSNLELPSNEGEIGYWIGVPFWGKGLIPEATRELIRHGFQDLKLKKIWCGYYEGNEKSRRVQEKCGFQYHHTKKDLYQPQLKENRTLHVTCIVRKDWER